MNQTTFFVPESFDKATAYDNAIRMLNFLNSIVSDPSLRIATDGLNPAHLTQQGMKPNSYGVELFLGRDHVADVLFTPYNHISTQVTIAHKIPDIALHEGLVSLID